MTEQNHYGVKSFIYIFNQFRWFLHKLLEVLLGFLTISGFKIQLQRWWHHSQSHLIRLQKQKSACCSSKMCPKQEICLVICWPSCWTGKVKNNNKTNLSGKKMIYGFFRISSIKRSLYRLAYDSDKKIKHLSRFKLSRILVFIILLKMFSLKLQPFPIIIS